MKCLFHGDDCWLNRADAKETDCDDITDKELRLRCKFEELYKVTEKQDVMNIDLIKDLNNDSDERWIPLHMIDNANAVILGISRNRGRPKAIVNEGYVGDKLESLTGKWTSIRLRADRKECIFHGESCWLTDSKTIIGSTEEHYWRALLPQIEPGTTVKIDVIVSPNFLQKEKIRISFNGEERLFGYTDWRYESMVSAFEKQGRHVKARIIHGEAS